MTRFFSALVAAALVAAFAAPANATHFGFSVNHGYGGHYAYPQSHIVQTFSYGYTPPTAFIVGDPGYRCPQQTQAADPPPAPPCDACNAKAPRQADPAPAGDCSATYGLFAAPRTYGYGTGFGSAAYGGLTFAAPTYGYGFGVPAYSFRSFGNGFHDGFTDVRIARFGGRFNGRFGGPFQSGVNVNLNAGVGNGGGGANVNVNVNAGKGNGGANVNVNAQAQPGKKVEVDVAARRRLLGGEVVKAKIKSK